MQYFNTLPTVYQLDPRGNIVTATNLMARSYLLPSLTKNVNLFYTYKIKEGDTPENLAYRYYNTTDRFWLVMYSNNLMDPQWDWPLTSKEFTSYLVETYGPAANSTDVNIIIAYTQSTPHHYEQQVTTQNSIGNKQQSITIQIDEDTFTQSLNETQTAQFPDGSTVTKTITYNQVSIYDYEVNRNEAKRNINIMKDSYAPIAERQFQALMA